MGESMTWTPRDLPRHINAWWWDAGHAPSFTYSGASSNEVLTWTDRLRGLVLTRDGSAPWWPVRIRDSEFGAAPRVYFDGSAGLRSAASSVVLTDTSEMGVWLVGRFTTARQNQRFVSYYSGSGGNDYLGFQNYIPLVRNGANDQIGSFRNDWRAVVPYAIGTVVVASSVMTSLGGGDIRFSVALNGGVANSATWAAGALTSGGRFGIGQRAGGWDSGDALVGDIYEVVIVSGRVTAQLNATVQQYLSAKWRIPLASRQRVQSRSAVLYSAPRLNPLLHVGLG